MQDYKTMEDLGDLNGKVVMLRADLNVPMDENFKVTNTARIDRTVPTIKALMNKGAKVVVISHFGRPEGKGDMKNSLSHVAPELEKALGKKVVFVKKFIKKDFVLFIFGDDVFPGINGIQCLVSFHFFYSVIL